MRRRRILGATALAAVCFFLSSCTVYHGIERSGEEGRYYVCETKGFLFYSHRITEYIVDPTTGKFVRIHRVK